jgi:hypothetical protein
LQAQVKQVANEGKGSNEVGFGYSTATNFQRGQ